MKSIVTSLARKASSWGRARRPYRPRVLKPRGALSRPPGSHLSVEVFNEKPGQYPAVHITAEAHGKIRALIATCRLEVSWLSPTKVNPDGSVTIYDVLVPYQECTGGSTAKLETNEFDGEDLLLTKLMNERKFDMIRDLICWGHSHVNFSTFASGLDEATTRHYVKKMRDEMGKTRFVRLIANKGDDLFASLYLFDQGKAIHHAPIQAEPPDTKRWMGWARREVGEKVIERVYQPEDFGDGEGFVYYYDPQQVAEQVFNQFQQKLQLQPGEQATTGAVQPCPKSSEK